jgi:hypothetical protein
LPAANGFAHRLARRLEGRQSGPASATILIDAREGRKDLVLDRDYKRLRSPLIGRADLSDVVPKFVRANQDLRSYWSHIKSVSENGSPKTACLVSILATL